MKKLQENQPTFVDETPFCTTFVQNGLSTPETPTVFLNVKSAYLNCRTFMRSFGSGVRGRRDDWKELGLVAMPAFTLR